MAIKVFGFMIVMAASFMFYCEVFCKENHTFTVVFCDGRPPRQVVVKCFNPYDESRISTPYGHPVSEWNGLLNVCEVTVIK